MSYGSPPDGIPAPDDIPPDMFPRTTAGTTYPPHNYAVAPPGSHRGHSLDTYPSFPITYPESSQRTRLHHAQFRQLPPGPEPPPNETYLQATYAPSGSGFSQPPIPSDRPPPSLRLPSSPSFPPIAGPSGHSSTTNYPSSSTNSRLSSTLSLSDDEDATGYNNQTYRHEQHAVSDFIPM
ncbi:hypothetical protein DFH06DRAFT_264131 [Mycena polygramma]|nr:hypothetical protein DFH06DRAFT_264131 [Mycena polygramma]